MGQESHSNLGPFKLFVDLITETNDIFPVFLAVGRIGSFISRVQSDKSCFLGWRDGSTLVKIQTALPEVPSSNPSNHMVAHNHL